MTDVETLPELSTKLTYGQLHSKFAYLPSTSDITISLHSAMPHSWLSWLHSPLPHSLRSWLHPYEWTTWTARSMKLGTMSQPAHCPYCWPTLWIQMCTLRSRCTNLLVIHSRLRNKIGLCHICRAVHKLIQAHESVHCHSAAKAAAVVPTALRKSWHTGWYTCQTQCCSQIYS